MSNVEVIFYNIGESKYFSTTDLESEFHQILMEEKDMEKTALSVNSGKYKYLGKQFGLKNAPSMFQRIMNHVYIYDIIVYSKTLKEHIFHLKDTSVCTTHSRKLIWKYL